MKGESRPFSLCTLLVGSAFMFVAILENLVNLDADWEGSEASLCETVVVFDFARRDHFPWQGQYFGCLSFSGRRSYSETGNLADLFQGSCAAISPKDTEALFLELTQTLHGSASKALP